MKYAKGEHLRRHVVVQIAHLGDAERALPELERYLNPTDHERAGRFRFKEDRSRFIIGRGLLGRCLGTYFELPVGPLSLGWTDRGQPFLREYPETKFSISHSGDVIALALSIQTEIGVDLEALRAASISELASRIFSSADLKDFQALPPEDALPSFFRAWTGKEACLKAKGVGISAGLKEVSFALHPGEGPRPVVGRPDWQVQTLPLPAGYIGTLAWNDPEKKMDFQVMDLTKP